MNPEGRPWCARSDPRMNRALEARLTNPDLTLYQCLSIGGFEYTADDSNAVDNENVTLIQRKNQLNRRVRSFKSRAASREQTMSDTAKRKKKAASRSAAEPEPEPAPDLRATQSNDDANSASNTQGLPLLDESAGSISALLQQQPPAAPLRSSQPQWNGHDSISSLTASLLAHGRTNTNTADHSAANDLSSSVMQLSSSAPPNQHPSASTDSDPRQEAAMRLFQQELLALQRQSDNGSQLQLQLQQPLQQMYVSPPQQQTQQSNSSAFGVAPTQQFNSNTQLDSTPRFTAAATTLTPQHGFSSSTTSQSSNLLGMAPDARQANALRLYREQVGALYDRCMAASGYGPQERQVSAPSYQSFVVLASGGEWERVQRDTGLVRTIQGAPRNNGPSDKSRFI
ncbi:expressed unknown protein [Seminavis robusta]|uniref:Uncharacterized protein n=1 Tax=Seminavis robusta TaxID=568900 RepID=A0A9N8DDU0_9STRA|nr:expressed unknown protein [Seminavis robusta]|eukprot:Sro48_g028340.1 n/a (398) ;mRNA; r:100762-102180